MKKRQLLSLLLVFCIMIIFSPLSAFAEGEETRTMELVINAGEGFAVWNTDIAASGVTSNMITVKTKEGTFYDAVLAADTDSAEVLSNYSYGIDEWQTSGYIKEDKTAADGMLVWIKVSSGAVLLTVESTGIGMSDKPLALYKEEGSPLVYFESAKGQSAEYDLPKNCNLSYISLVMCGTDETSVKRIISEDSNSYELYSFCSSGLTCFTYENGNRTGAFGIPYISSAAKDGEVFHCAYLLFPCGAVQKNIGSMKTERGYAVYASIRFINRNEANRASWADGISPGGFTPPSVYKSLFDRFYDEKNSTFFTVSTQELNIQAVNEAGAKVLESGLSWSQAVADYTNYVEIDTNTVNCIDASGMFKGLTDFTTQSVSQFEPDAIISETTRSFENSSECSLLNIVQSLEYSASDNTNAGQIDLGISIFTQTDNYEEWEGDNKVRTHIIPPLIGFDPSCLYNIYVGGGTADKASVADGEDVTVTANVPSGMSFIEWECNAGLPFDKYSPSTTCIIRGDKHDISFIAKLAPIEYTVTAGASVGGRIGADKAQAAAGDTVTVTVSPDAGYAASSVSCCADGDIGLIPDDADQNTYTFTMPAKNVTLSAAFEKKSYPVTTDAECGSVTADRGTAHAGDTVTLTLSPQNASHFLGVLNVMCGTENIETAKVNDSTYTFTMPAGEVSVHAVFVMNYCVGFENWNGRILEWCDVISGQTPEYTGETPVREQNAMYTYTFAGWDRPIAPVSGDEWYIPYTATYTATPRSYTVTFSGADGTTLQAGSIPYGETPAYTGDVPVKATDDSFVYTFEGWAPTVMPVTGDATYTPLFSTVPVMHEGRNRLTLEQGESMSCPFTPQESGYYRILSAGDAIQPECYLTDDAGNRVGLRFGGYYPERDYHFEFIAQLEGGETYNVIFTPYHASGNISLFICNVDMHNVHTDPAIAHGTVELAGSDEDMVYTGQRVCAVCTPDPGYGLLRVSITDENGKHLMPDGSYFIMPDSDVTVTATFAPAHSIDYDADYGVFFSTNEAVFTDWNESTEMFEERAAAGAGIEYSLGWDEGYVLDDFHITTQSGEAVTFSGSSRYLNTLEVWFTMPDEPITVTAKVVPTYELTLAPGGIGGEPLKFIVKNNADIKAPLCPFNAPRDKAFGGWATEADGAVVYEPRNSFSSSEDITLYAVWEDKPYTDTTVSSENGNTVLTAALYNMPGEVTLAAAAYKNGGLVSIDTIKTAEDSESFTLSCEYDEIRVFVWDNIESLIPVTDAERVSLN